MVIGEGRCLPSEARPTHHKSSNSRAARVRSLALALTLALGLLALGAAGAQAAEERFGKTTVGAIVDNGIFSNEKAVHTATLTVSGSVTKLSVYLVPGVHSPSPQALRAVIYSDSAGAPAALLAVGKEVSYASTVNGEGWFDLPFSSPVALAPGTYWIGFITGEASEGLGYRYDEVANSRAWNVNSFAAGPSNPFGAANKDSEQASIYASYVPRGSEGGEDEQGEQGEDGGDGHHGHHGHHHHHHHGGGGGDLGN